MNSINSTDKILKPKPLFWALNTSGWFFMTLVNITFQTKYFTQNFEAIYYSFFVTGIGFLVSLLARFLILKWHIIHKKIIVMIVSLFVLSFVLSIISGSTISFFIVTFISSIDFEFSTLISAIFNFNLVFFIWILLYSTSLFVSNQQHLSEQKLKLSLQLKEAELNNLRKQLSPHFLFNAINNIRTLILINPESARDALLNVSDLLRYALSYQKKNTVTVIEEMEIVEGYINLNKIHLGDTVNFSINLETALEGLKIPPMTIQLLIENAIKHGKIMNGRITLNIKTEQSKKIIEVINPGSLKSSKEMGIGLANLKQRLQSMYGEKASFNITELNGLITAKIEIV